jgi:aryl-alcohol dehydrogenase-like predicted oxidoreductase
LTEEGQAKRDRQTSKALDLGVNFIDVYENEGQWAPLAKLVNGRRDRVYISASRNVKQPLPENIDRAVRQFGGYVDMYRLHYLPTKGEPEPNYIEDWDILRRAKEAGKLRSIGISCHTEEQMMYAMRDLEGIDYVIFPYNFIHARADYSRFLPAAIERGIALVAMKPLAAGSIAKLDPKLRTAATRPEDSRFQLYNSRERAILPQVVAELTKTLDQLPDETLCQAAVRYAYSRAFLSGVMCGMFDEQWVDDNYAALTNYRDLPRRETAALERVLHPARRLAALEVPGWLPPHYRWLEEEWRA